jgi:hypothetical protein
MPREIHQALFRMMDQKNRLPILRILVMIAIATFLLANIYRIESYLGLDATGHQYIRIASWVLIILFASYFLKIKIGIGTSGANSGYKRLEKWITKRIGHIDKGMGHSRLRDRLVRLCSEEESKSHDPKKLNGFRRYIESSRYKDLLA